MLPTPPTEQEKYLYVKSNKYVLYLFSTVSTALLLTGAGLFATHRYAFIWYLPFILLLGWYLGVSYFVGIFSKVFSRSDHEKIVGGGADYLPTVDVYLPSAGESLDVLENTYKHVAGLEWPGVKVYVLDDSGRAEVAAKALIYGFTYFARSDRGHMKKAGNIRHAFPKTQGELLLILDADFAPRADFLKEIVPYFVDEQIALVQTPQYFPPAANSQTWIQAGAASIQELFYRLIQVSRNHWGAAICVGTNAVYRREALEPFGGTYEIEHSEDVHTGFNLLKHGWKVVYVPIILASGLCPDALISYFTQQYRWCMGSTSLFFNRELFWKAKIPLVTRICYLSGMFYYMATALGVFFTPIPGLLMVWFSPDWVFWFNSIFSLPSFVMGIVFMSYWNKAPYGLRAVRARYVAYYAHVFALADKMLGTTMSWVPTGGGVKKLQKFKYFKLALASHNILVLMLAYTGAFFSMESWTDYDFYPFLVITTFYSLLHLSCLTET